MYTFPSASARLAHSIRSRGPRTGSSERSTTDSAWASSSESKIGSRTPPHPAASRATEENRADEVERQFGESVSHDVRVVLAVDERDRLHECVVTSDSIRAVYFSKASVSVENWMIFSCPWKGYLRQTSTCAPVTSTTL